SPLCRRLAPLACFLACRQTICTRQDSTSTLASIGCRRDLARTGAWGCLDLVRVLRGDHLLERARREDVAVEQQELLVGDRLGVLEADERAVLGLVGERGRNVDALRVVERRRRVGDSDDERA